MNRTGSSLPSVGQMKEAAETTGIYADIGLRSIMVIAVALLLSWLNYEVMSFLKTVFMADLELVKANPSASATRLVTSQVIQTLIGATVVQVGLATVAIMSYLFPKPPTSK